MTAHALSRRGAGHAGSGHRSLLDRIRGRIRGLAVRWKMDNLLVGWLVELFGNRVRLHGLTIDVDNRLVQRRHKSTIYFGIYELGEIACVRRYVRPADAVVELGGSIGVVACVTNRLLNDPARHVVVEANPELIPTLQRNKDLNRCGFTIVHAAAGCAEPTVEFSVSRHFLMGRAGGSDGRRVRVDTTRLAALVERFGGAPCVLVCDIEGGEVGVVETELEAIRRAVRLVIMETHERYTGVRNQEMLESLRNAGFGLIERIDDVVVLQNARFACESVPAP
jgi:FkbM family methyltransferase